MRAFLTACGLAMAAACTTPPPPLSSTFDSPDALGRAVLAAFQAGDREALLRLALTEQEFRQRVWPELPSARPERNLPFSYVWGDLKQKSDASLSRLLARYRGHRGELTQVRFDDARTPYKTFVVHRKSVFAIREGGGEATEEIRLCGSMIEQAGQWKVFSYVVDD
jgi:hypothetical protein